MVPAVNCDGTAAEQGSLIYAPYCGDYTLMWPEAVFPYVKDQMGGASVWLCPGLEHDINDIQQGGDYPLLYLQEFISYGFNKDYLQPDPDCSPASALVDVSSGQPIPPWGRPVGLAQIEAPASTVMFAETKPSTFCYGTNCNDTPYYPGAYQNAPASGSVPPVTANGITMTACSNGIETGPPNWDFNLPADGWGVDDEYDTSPFGNPPGNTSTGLFDPRHTGGGNVAFCDGHCKWYMPGNLAAGTNWYKGIPQANVRITDLSQYLWSLNKEGTSDM